MAENDLEPGCLVMVKGWPSGCANTKAAYPPSVAENLGKVWTYTGPSSVLTDPTWPCTACEFIALEAGGKRRRTHRCCVVRIDQDPDGEQIHTDEPIEEIA